MDKTCFLGRSSQVRDPCLTRLTMHYLFLLIFLNFLFVFFPLFFIFISFEFYYFLFILMSNCYFFAYNFFYHFLFALLLKLLIFFLSLIEFPPTINTIRIIILVFFLDSYFLNVFDFFHQGNLIIFIVLVVIVMLFLIVKASMFLLL